MTTNRTLWVAGMMVVLLAACGGSENGDVTIATDDPPPGSPSHAPQANTGSANTLSDLTGSSVAATLAQRDSGR